MKFLFATALLASLGLRYITEYHNSKLASLLCGCGYFNQYPVFTIFQLLFRQCPGQIFQYGVSSLFADFQCCLILFKLLKQNHAQVRGLCSADCRGRFDRSWRCASEAIFLSHGRNSDRQVRKDLFGTPCKAR